MDGKEKPSLNRGRPSVFFVELQTLEKFGVSPLDYYVGKDAEWKNHPELKALIIAYQQLLAEEEQRIHKEMNKQQSGRPPSRR